jgi:hypothetical protein
MPELIQSIGCLETIFWAKNNWILCCGSVSGAFLNPKVGTRDGNNWIRDNHPGSATLTLLHPDQFRGIDSASLCGLAGRYDNYGCRNGPPGLDSIPGLLKMFTNTGSVQTKAETGFLYEYLHYEAYPRILPPLGDPDTSRVRTSHTCERRHLC